MSTEEEAYRGFGNAIVIQAAKDWRDLCNGEEGCGTLKEIKRFFRSEWCAFLCGNVDPLFILRELENELKTTKDN